MLLEFFVSLNYLIFIVITFCFNYFEMFFMGDNSGYDKGGGGFGAQAPFLILVEGADPQFWKKAMLNFQVATCKVPQNYILRPLKD